MSEALTASFIYDAKFNLNSVKTVLNALSKSVVSNWGLDGDEYCDLQPRLAVNIPEWIVAYNSDAVQFVNFTGFRRVSREFYFSYSPMSFHLAGFSLTETSNFKLNAYVYISKKSLYELVGDRERDRMERESVRLYGHPNGPPSGNDLAEWNEGDDRAYDWTAKYGQLDNTPSVWPYNCSAFNRIIDALRSSLSTHDVQVDSKFTDRGKVS